MRFYFDKSNYEKIYIQVGDIIYHFDLDELIDQILCSGESVEEYCNLINWNFEYPLFDLNNDNELKKFTDTPMVEIEYDDMINIIKNCVLRYILDTETDYTIDKLEKILGFFAIKELKDILDENLKKGLFLK